MLEFLKKDQADSLRKLAVEVGALDPTSVWDDPSFDAQKARELYEQIQSGDFKIPYTKLPVDFHRFFSVCRDWSDDNEWKTRIMHPKYGIEQRWLFNAMSANYPTLSMSDQFKQIFTTIFGEEFFPSPAKWKWVLSFFLSIDNPTQYLKWRPTSKVVSDYKAHIESLMTGDRTTKFPSYVHLEEVHDREVANGFFTNTYSTSNTMWVPYRDRWFLSLAPTEMLNSTKHRFSLSGIQLLIDHSEFKYHA